MQRLLSTKTPLEAAKMSGFTIAVLFSPRYLMIASFAVLAIVFLTPDMAPILRLILKPFCQQPLLHFFPMDLRDCYWQDLWLLLWGLLQP